MRYGGCICSAPICTDRLCALLSVGTMRSEMHPKGNRISSKRVYSLWQLHIAHPIGQPVMPTLFWQHAIYIYNTFMRYRPNVLYHISFIDVPLIYMAIISNWKSLHFRLDISKWNIEYNCEKLYSNKISFTCGKQSISKKGQNIRLLPP